MKIGYFNVANGCAGDMITASLAGCCPSNFLKTELKKIQFPNPYDIKSLPVERQLPSSHSFQAHQFIVTLGKKEKPNSYTEIKKLFETSRLEKSLKTKILNIFHIIALAESRVHKEPLEKIHFHQVGQTDALVEIASCVILLDYLKIEKIYCSPVAISNPAPATLEISRGVPVIFKNIPFEITTPTGMAIIKGIVDEFSDSVSFKVIGSSYGTGTNKKIKPDVLFFAYGKEHEKDYEKIGILETSIDDMNPALFEHIIEKLYQDDALEVSIFTGMTKKTRTMFNLRVLCLPENKEKLMEIIFRESSTIGVRYREEERIALKRKEEKIKTEFGEIPVKFSYYNGKIVNVSPEYRACKKAAIDYKLPLKTIFSKIIKKYDI